MNDRKSANALLWFALGTGVLTTYFVYTSSLDPFNLPKSVIILGGGIAVLFGLVASAKSVEKSRRFGILLLLAFLLSYLVAGVLGSDSTHRLIFGAFSRATGLMSYFGMVLLAKPQILLLDEPTSGMTKAEAAKTADLCKQLLASGAVKSIVVVEHNIDFIRRVSEKVLVMHRGSIISSGTIDEIQKDQLVRDSFLGRMK